MNFRKMATTDSVLVGELVLIDFWDHREIGTEPHEAYEFTAVGRVRQITDISISIDNWYFADADEDIRSHHANNVNGYCIVKRAIKNIRLLSIVEEEEPPLHLVS